MKTTLTGYKIAYRKAKTLNSKSQVMTNASLNLPYSEFQEFVKWQIDYMNML